MEDTVKTYIIEKGGTFIKFYKIKTDTKHRCYVDYVCANGHPNTKKRTDSIKKGWCAECTKNTIDDALNLATKMGGKFISDVFINTATRYKWQCENNHTFEAKYTNVHAGKWCKQCLIYSIEDMQKIAAERGGKCLSTELKTISHKLLWECANRHQWETTGVIIMRGHWCTECTANINERTCRKILEYLYDKQFIKKRPDWLLSTDGERLELDCFNEELKIALEFNGKQHYERVVYWQTEDDFKRRLRLDKEKIELCKKNNVDLITVPYTVKYDDLYTYIKNLCKNVPNNKPDTIDYKVLEITGHGSEKLGEINKYIQEKFGGGKILSKTYVANYEPLDFECKNKHQFKQTWSIIKQDNSFCKLCTYDNIADKTYTGKIKPFCEKYNIILDGKYDKAKTPAKWKCKLCDAVIHTCSWDSLRKKKLVQCDMCN